MANKTADSSTIKIEAYCKRVSLRVKNGKTARKSTPAADFEPSVKTDVQPSCWNEWSKKRDLVTYPSKSGLAACSDRLKCVDGNINGATSLRSVFIMSGRGRDSCPISSFPRKLSAVWAEKTWPREVSVCVV